MNGQLSNYMSCCDKHLGNFGLILLWGEDGCGFGYLIKVLEEEIRISIVVISQQGSMANAFQLKLSNIFLEVHQYRGRNLSSSRHPWPASLGR